MVAFSSDAVHRIIFCILQNNFSLSRHTFLNRSKATSVKVYCWQDTLC